MEKKFLDVRRVRMLQGELTQIVCEARFFFRTDVLLDFDGKRGRLRSTRTESDERTPDDSGILSENLFARLSEERALRCFQALGLSADKPEPALGIEITTISHAVPDRVAWRLGNFNGQ